MPGLQKFLAMTWNAVKTSKEGSYGGLHSSTFRLDVSTSGGIRWVFWFFSMTQTVEVELRSGRVEAPGSLCMSMTWRATCARL